MNQLHTKIKTLLCLLFLCAVTGCSMGKGDGWHFTQLRGTKALDIRRAIGLKKDELAPPQVPTRIVSTWTDTVLHRQGEEAQRGFGGRLLFFNEEDEDSIRVEGQLVVYAYDDSGRAAHETHPSRRYIFPAEQFVRHESDATAGASYSVWLPWDAIGGEQKNISLIARFEPKAGRLVVGEQTKHLLPGIRHLASGETAPATEPVGEIQLAKYTQQSKLQLPTVSATPQPSQARQVTSIALEGKSWEQRLSTPQSRSETSSIRSTTNATARATATVLPGPTR
ncbi:MAG: hypothetical protein GXP24_03995 [Planctomycetes bacterium]|nr:hypothetical protein [Planctomycetota bacterium]